MEILQSENSIIIFSMLNLDRNLISNLPVTDLFMYDYTLLGHAIFLYFRCFLHEIN